MDLAHPYAGGVSPPAPPSQLERQNRWMEKGTRLLLEVLSFACKCHPRRATHINGGPFSLPSSTRSRQRSAHREVFRMKTAIKCAVCLGLVGSAMMAFANGAGQPPAPPNPDSQYRLGPDSLPQDGVPKGEIRGPFTSPEPGLPRHPAHLLGLRACPVRPGGAGRPHGLPGRAGLQG